MYPANQNIRDRSISLFHMLTHRLNTYHALSEMIELVLQVIMKLYMVILELAMSSEHRINIVIRTTS